MKHKIFTCSHAPLNQNFKSDDQIASVCQSRVKEYTFIVLDHGFKTWMERRKFL